MLHVTWHCPRCHTALHRGAPPLVVVVLAGSRRPDVRLPRSVPQQCPSAPGQVPKLGCAPAPPSSRFGQLLDIQRVHRPHAKPPPPLPPSSRPPSVPQQAMMAAPPVVVAQPPEQHVMLQPPAVAQHVMNPFSAARPHPKPQPPLPPSSRPPSVPQQPMMAAPPVVVAQPPEQHVMLQPPPVAQHVMHPFSSAAEWL